MIFVRQALCAAALAAFAASGAATAATVVPLGHFDRIALRGGGHVVVKYGTEQRVTILAGSTEFTKLTVRDGRELTIDACNDSCPHQYELKIEVVTPLLAAAAIEGGGEITATGGFPDRRDFAVAVNGGGDLDMRAISAASVQAAVNGGGDVHVTATGSLSAAVSGGGSIVYGGNPQVSQAIDGGGSVEHASK